MKHNIYIITLIVALFFSCKGSVTQFNTHTLTVDKQYDICSDSTYFKRVGCMQFYNDSLYLLDTERQKFLVVSKNFDDIKNIALPGRADNEIISAGSFYLFNDTAYIVDQGKIKYYNRSGYLSSIPLEFLVKEERFYSDINNLYVPNVSGDNTYCTISKHNHRQVNRYGSLERIGSIDKTIRRNSRAVLANDKCIITIPNAFAYFEYFDKQTGNMLGRIDFSHIDFMSDNLSYIKSQQDEEKSFYVLNEDSYIVDDNLFILSNSFKGGFNTNTVLHIVLTPKPEIKTIYKLPGKYYSSICVINNQIIAFNKDNSSIEYLLL